MQNRWADAIFLIAYVFQQSALHNLLLLVVVVVIIIIIIIIII